MQRPVDESLGRTTAASVSHPLDGLPDAFGVLIGELAAAFPPEPSATCSACVMKPGPARPAHRVTFSDPARCCTYHPDLPNHLAGRALARGGPGAEQVRVRIALLDGVSAYGIRSTPGYRSTYRAAGGGFGNDPALTCPYWSARAPEGRGCSIHLDRDAVCRTWSCRIGGGVRGQDAWLAFRAVLVSLELTLAEACVVAGAPPGPDAGPAEWEDWFRWCAVHVGDLGPGEVDALRGERLEALTRTARSAAAARDAELPERPMATIRGWTVHAGGVDLVSWSAYDPFEAPRWVFQLLARLDGRTTWREAVAATEVEVGEPVRPGLVAELHRHGLLGPPDHVDVAPGVTVLGTSR